MRGTYSFTKRLLAVVICIAMIAAYLPGMALPAAAAVAEDKTVDPSTMDDWQAYYGPDVLSTEYAGGVWTDKSVFKSFADYAAAAGVTNFVGAGGSALSQEVLDMLATGEDNFLVTLSAIAANQEITGYTTAPTDTMLVLDVSQSMDSQGYTADMIAAANDTIKTLMSNNANNRVGVVLFCGNQYQGQNQPANTTIVLLPLDHYTSRNSSGDFLVCQGNRETTVYIADGVYNSANTEVNNDEGKEVVGATYTQNGLYKAWLQFSTLSAADTVIPQGQPQAGTKRTPVVVLMSDGQPTIGDTTYYDIGSSTVGNGGSPGETTGDQLTFLTQLTAAWVKAKIADKYSIAQDDVKFYTLGLNTRNNRYATDVLNPAASTNTTVAGWWDTFLAATPNEDGEVRIIDEWGSWNDWYIYKIEDNMITSADQRKYVTQYFPADDTEKLAEAFAAIADELTMGTPYVTLVTGDSGDLDGYITFEDKLAGLMEVKDIKGLAIGDKIFTGAELAKGFTTDNMGTVDEPKPYGDEFINTIKERLGITDTAVAQQLAINAYTSGQLSYTSDTEFSNYIGWYADDDGNYKGFWQESDGYGAEAAPEGATYINKSYGYLGASSTQEGASDMMHVVVMVHTNIATGDQTIVYKIPASLIPTVTYKVELEGTDLSKPKSITREDAFPLRLLAEVGLRSDVNEVNIDQKVADYEAAVHEYVEAGGEGGHIHKNADGTYTFYTNQWGDGDGGEVNYDEPMTHLVTQSHFHPAVDNGRYYFTEASVIYRDENGTAYTGTTAPSGTGYYYARSHYEKVGSTVRVVTEYLPIAAVTIAKAVAGQNGQWLIPAGTPYQETERFNAPKDPNATGTLTYANRPAVLHNEAGYNAYAFLGNNGTFNVEPAQGIALSKTVTETVEGAPTEFTFTVTLSQAVASPVITDLDGNVLTGISSVDGNKITVKLTAGQTVVITGIPTGTTYIVAEEESSYYAASSNNASGTVAAYTISPVDFTNTPKGYGDLIVSKDVTHPFVTVPSALTEKQFTINVTLSGADVANKTFQTTGLAGVTEVTTNANGTFTVQLRDGESITILDLPEGTTYTTTETLSATADKGFSMVAASSILTGQIVKDAAAQAHVVNDYAPSEPVASITVSGTKTVNDEGDTFDWNGKSFTFKLEQYHPETGHYTQIGDTVTVTEQGGTYEFKDALKLNAIGTYYYKVSEVIPEEADRLEGMSYDASAGRFVVYVTDNDVNGELEFEIRDYTTGQTINGTNSVFTFTKNFVNTHTTEATYIEFTVDKQITDPHGIGVSEAGFLFGLYPVDENGDVATEPAYTMRTTLVGDTQDGKATFHIPLTKAGQTTYILKEIKPIERQLIPGMVYDTTEYTVVVTAAAQGGKLVPSVTFSKGGTAVAEEDLVFDNVVNLNTTSEQWEVEKVMAGITPADAETFTFTLTETDGSFVTAKTGGVTDSVTVTGAGKVSFEKIDYTAVGTHYYVIQETAGSRAGMTYDPTVYHVTVNVTVSGDDLVANTSISKLGGGTADSVVFTNTYNITETEQVQLSGTKLLPEREQLAGEFTFGLWEGTDTTGTPLYTAQNLTNGKFTFPVITYTGADIGTHTYTLKEIPHEDAENGVYQGITYSAETYTVTVVVSDDGQGGLDVTKTIRNAANQAVTDAEIVITNHYDPADTSITLTGSKSWYDENAGEYLTVPADKFTFELYESVEGFGTQGDKITDVQNTAGNATDKAGRFSIKLDYTKAGDHYYILREKLGSDKGVSYDTTRYFIRVLVSDDGVGGLHPTVTMTKSGGAAATAITFSNYYKPAETTATVEGDKILTGRDSLAIAEGEFSFELRDADNNLVETVSTAAGGHFSFSAIEYEKSGTYTYTVKEVVPTGHVNNVYKGVTYDTASYTVTVNVTDNGSGELVADVTYPTGGLKITNAYEGKATSFDLEGEKAVTGDRTALLEGESYTFYLYDANNNHVGTAVSDAQGKFVFENIPLNKAKEFEFTVKEVAPEGGVLNGVTYSTLEYKVYVTVTDNTQQGELVAGTPVIKLNGQTVEELVFTNTYLAASTTATLRAIKVLENKTLTRDAFTFELLDENNEVLQTAKNAANGDIIFEAIEYTEAGSYQYKIREVIPEDAVNNVYQGITYDTSVIDVTVEVKDNGYGRLIATPLYEGGAVRFTNSYAVTQSAKVDITGSKTLTGKGIADGMFAFQLFDSTGAQVGGDVKNAGGSFTFEGVELTEAKDYVFTVREVIPSAAVDTVYEGIDYDEREYKVYITAWDNGVGGLDATVPTFNVGDVDTVSMEFVNKYSVDGAVYTDISGEKKLTGKPMTEGEFTFELYDVADLLVASTTNTAGGQILFEDVALTEMGEHYFTVVEKNTGVDGMDYDEREYAVKVVVVDNGVGGLAVENTEITLDGDPAQILFENTYAPAGISVDLQIKKEVQSLTAQTISPKGFQFLLADKDGNELDTVKADADGNAKFSLSFDAEDIGETFDFTVSEVDTGKTGVVYSETVYAVQVKITQAQDGTLVPTVTVDGESAEDVTMKFVNVYKPSVTPVTGDDFNATLFFGLMVISCFGLAAVIVTKKREEAKETAE